MVKKSRGFRSRTRKKLRQKIKRPAITKFLQEFKKNQRVIILQEPFSHKGMPHARFKGKTGKVVSIRGKSYIIKVTDRGKIKKIISRPEHLRAI